MSRKSLQASLITLGIILILFSAVGFVPHAPIDYDVTSVLFALGFVCLLLAFAFRKKPSEERESVSKPKAAPSRKRKAKKSRKK